MKKKKPDLEGLLAVVTDAPGAWPKGTRVLKLATPEKDSHQPGDMATVIGSMKNPGPQFPQVKFMYCLEWDDAPGVPVFCADWKLQKVTVQ